MFIFAYLKEVLMGIVIRQSIKGTFVNYVGAFIGFLTTMFVVTKFLKPEEIGLTKVIYEVSFLFASLAQLGTSASAMRFFPYFRDPEKNNNGFFFYLLLMPSVGTVIFLSLYYLFRDPITDFFIHNSSLFVDYYNYAGILIVFLVFWIVFETYSNLLMRIVVPKLIREVGVRLMLVAIYFLYAFHYLNLNGFVMAYVFVYGIALLLTLLYVSRISTISLKHDFSFVNKPLRIKILKYTLFLIAGALGGTIINQLDIFMVSSQMGLSFTGIYTIAFYMAAMIEMPARSMTAISSPIAAAALKEGDLAKANELYKKVSLHQFIAGSTLFLFIWINIDNIFAIIPNGTTYEAGKWVVFFIALSKLVSVTLGFGGTLISFSRYYYWGLYFTFFLTGLTIYTNYLLIPRLGMTGAALATFITCLISYSWQQWIVLKKVKGNPYTFGIVKQTFLIMLLCGFNCFLPDFNNPWGDGIFRSVIVSVFGIVLFYTWNISEEICLMIKNVLVFRNHNK